MTKSENIGGGPAQSSLHLRIAHATLTRRLTNRLNYLYTNYSYAILYLLIKTSMYVCISDILTT